MKRDLANIFNRSFVKGVASIFFPGVIHVTKTTTATKSDAENIASDWQRVGSYFHNAIAQAKR